MMIPVPLLSKIPPHHQTPQVIAGQAFSPSTTYYTELSRGNEIEKI
jgi:hypothetical protein